MRLFAATLLTVITLPLYSNAQAEPIRPLVRPVITQTAQPTTIRHIRLKIRSMVVTTAY